MTLFIAYGHFITETNPVGEFVSVGTFFTREAAEQLVREENDVAQADMLSIMEIPMFDNYGFPVSPADYAAITDRLIGE